MPETILRGNVLGFKLFYNIMDYFLPITDPQHWDKLPDLALTDIANNGADFPIRVITRYSKHTLNCLIQEKKLAVQQGPLGQELVILGTRGLAQLREGAKQPHPETSLSQAIWRQILEYHHKHGFNETVRHNDHMRKLQKGKQTLIIAYKYPHLSSRRILEIFKSSVDFDCLYYHQAMGYTALLYYHGSNPYKGLKAKYPDLIQVSQIRF